MNSKVYLMGRKQGLYLSQDVFSKIKISLRTPIKIVFYKNENDFSYFTTYNRIISLRYEALKFLEGAKEAAFKIEPIKYFEKPKNMFHEGQIDLGFFVSDFTSNGLKVVCESFKSEGSEWLLLWSYHSRGSSKQIVLRRFLNIEKFGNFLGQMQAEGTKQNAKKLEFANKLPLEHIDFINYLLYFGLDDCEIMTDCIYHEKIKDIDEEIQNFQDLTGRNIRGKYMTCLGKGGSAFKTYLRNSLVTDLFLSCLDTTRKYLVEASWGSKEFELFEAFFAKILTGDGTIDIDQKGRKTPQARVKLVDRNLSYLEDYASLMRKYGLNPHINTKHIFVRSSINPAVIKRLYEIKAFFHTPNYEKLRYLLNKRKLN